MKGSGWRETPGEGGHPVGRLEAFSDGVFSIAITLLVLEIVLPLHSERDLIGALLAQWPSYLAYVVSFFTIGWVWIAHGATTSHIVRADGIFMLASLAPGHYVVSVAAQGYKPASANVSVSSGQMPTRNFQIEPAGRE